MRILENKARCRVCGELIFSMDHEADVNKFCSCGAIAVSGGNQSILRIGHHRDIEELSLKDYDR